MNRHSALATLAFLSVLARPASPQAIQLPPGPVPAGGTVTVTILNDQSDGILEVGMARLRSTGELVLPEVYFWSDALSSIAPGQSWSFPLAVPATGPGSSGSFLLYYPTAKTAVARLDVIAADAEFPALHAFPSKVHYGYGSYLATITAGGMEASWAIANTSSADHVLGAQDAIRLHAPGSKIPLAALSLAGRRVDAGRSLKVPLPLAGLPVGPYDVVVTLQDPQVGTITRRAGVHAGAERDYGYSMPAASLHLPGGATVPAGGSLPAHVLLSIDTPALAEPLFALLIGFAPGSTALDGGPVLPLSVDTLVLGSLGGLNGALVGNVGLMSVHGSGCYCYGGFYRSNDIAIVHPGVAALGGVELRAAAALYVPGQGFTASQPMPLRFE